MRILCIFGLLLLSNMVHAQEPASLADALLLHASFDDSGDADFAVGDKTVYTAKSLKRENVQPGLRGDAVSLNREHGRHGGSLVFTKKTDQIVFYKGSGNLPPANKNFQGSYSFWLSLTPDADLPPGYVDPLQITDKKWNDASFFVDFTKELPRTFRLGVFSDHKFWNPKNRKYDDIPDKERPLISVSNPPFARDRWTHIGITFRNFNGDQTGGVATLYLNGKSQGDLQRSQNFTWNQDRLAIMLGIYYVGKMDDLAIFNRALTAGEMKNVFELPGGISSLRKTSGP